MSNYRNNYNYKYSINKSIQQSQDLLNQSYRRAMNKFGIGISDNSISNRNDIGFSRMSNFRFNNSEYKKSYSVIPTSHEPSNYQTSSIYNQNSTSQKIQFGIKSPPKDTSNQYLYRPINNNSYISATRTSDSPSKPALIFREHQSRKDYLEMINKEKNERKQKIPSTKRNYEYSPIMDKYPSALSSSPNIDNAEKFSPQTSIFSSPDKLRYLSLEIDAQNQENKKKASPQSNNFSPTSKENYYLSLQKEAYNQDNRKKSFLQSDKYSPSHSNYYKYHFSPNSTNNKEYNQKSTTNSINVNTNPAFSESKPQKSLKTNKLNTVSTNLQATPKNQLTATETQSTANSKIAPSISTPSQPQENNLPASTLQKPNYLPTKAPSQQEKSELPTTNATSSLPAKIPSQLQENKLPSTKESPQETNEQQTTNQIPKENTEASFPSSATEEPAKPDTPPSVSNIPNDNENQSLNQNGTNNIESLKNQTEFLDQVEESMKENAKEDTNTLLVERLKQYNNLNSENSPNKINSSPIKSSSNKSSPSKLSPSKSSPSKTSPSKASPNRSSPNKSSPNNSFESPSSFKSTENNNDNDIETDIDIEISFEENDSDFEEILNNEEEYDEDEFIRLSPIPSKTVRVDSYQFPKMFDLICTQDFFIKPKIKFMIESTIDLSDKMTSNVLKSILIPE